MPRPKRSKIAPSGPAPRVTKASKLATPIVASKNTSSKPTLGGFYDVSDPEDRVDTKTLPAKRYSGKEKAVTSRERALNVDMQGLDNADYQAAKTQIHCEKSIPRLQAGVAIEDDMQSVSSTSSIELSRREVIATPAIGASALQVVNFGRRLGESSSLRHRTRQSRNSSVDSNLAEDNLASNANRRDTSLCGVGSSMVGRRQLSIGGQNFGAPASSYAGVRMERTTPARPTSALKIGNFRRRAREPSILGTAQKRQQARPESDDDEDDFNPEDESTPLNLSKTRRNVSSLTAESSSNQRKRKLSAVQVPRSQSISSEPSRATLSERTIGAPISSDGEAENQDESELINEEAVISSIEVHSEGPDTMSETMAPPQSSSPSPSINTPASPIQLRGEPSRGRRMLRGRTPPPRTQDSPISSPPSLTHSPNRLVVATVRGNKPKRQVPPPSAFSTAQLQNLMPRRRRQTTRDPFDFESSDDEIDPSGLASDDDELSHLAARARPLRRNTMVLKTPAPLRKGKGRSVTKPNQLIGRHIYGKAVPASDKENEDDLDPDDSLAPIPDGEGYENPETTQELEKRIGKELKRAAKKFQEVDKWELEFEEVTASSSSPNDAR